MTGEELYELWRGEMAMRGVMAYLWRAISEDERNAWDAVADEIELRLDEAARKGVV